MQERLQIESDVLIVNSMERLACTVSPPPCFVGGERGHCRFLVFFILDPETRKNKLISPSLFPLLCRFTRKIRRKNPDSTKVFFYSLAAGLPLISIQCSAIQFAADCFVDFEDF